MEVELYYLFLYNMVMGKFNTSWKIDDVVRHINHLLGLGHCHLSYIFREANGVADSLAKLGSRLALLDISLTSTDVPSTLAGVLKLDEIGIPNHKKVQGQMYAIFFLSLIIMVSATTIGEFF
ncbi:hypothetical protein ACH5RR_032486 [Cinchona calisaya]|uniref:RNase H type-1 domain-containing protein n=1 Tax=Cinchona calisaya TaxID=153742 RepID=A0ABD2YI65_9GENT